MPLHFLSWTSMWSHYRNNCNLLRTNATSMAYLMQALTVTSIVTSGIFSDISSSIQFHDSTIHQFSTVNKLSTVLYYHSEENFKSLYRNESASIAQQNEKIPPSIT